jgi:hypothetical protein
MHCVKALVRFRFLDAKTREGYGRGAAASPTAALTLRMHRLQCCSGKLRPSVSHTDNHHLPHSWELLNEYDRPPALCPPRLHLYGSRRRRLLQRTLPQARGVADIQ